MAAIAEESAKNKGGRPKKVAEWPCHHCGGSHPIGDNPCHEPEAKKPVQKIVPVSGKDTSKLTDSKTAELFNTNRTYVNNAVKQWYLTRHSEKKSVPANSFFFNTAAYPFALINFIAVSDECKRYF